MGISVISTQNSIDLYVCRWVLYEESRASRSWPTKGRRFGDQIATKKYMYIWQKIKFPQFLRNRISGSPSNFFCQKNTLSHFTKTKHFYKTRKTQKLRKYRNYQNKIDNYYGFCNKKWKWNETGLCVGFGNKISKKTKIKLWNYR